MSTGFFHGVNNHVTICSKENVDIKFPLRIKRIGYL